jgi:hypothetical protein
MRLKKKPAEVTPEQGIPRRRDSGAAPLSFAQQRLWFLEQLGDSNYLVPATFRLTGPLDVAALERSLSEIAQRHEVLRTTFTAIDGQPLQLIAPHLSLALTTLDLSQLPPDELAVESRRLREEALRPFNLEKGPLFRASLLRIADEDHQLLLTMHHIVSDGWSLGVLIRELATLYERLATRMVARRRARDPASILERAFRRESARARVAHGSAASASAHVSGFFHHL